MLFYLVTFATLLLSNSGVLGWSYTSGDPAGPEHWNETYTDCGRVMQSPIDINTSRVLFLDTLQQFNLSEYWVTSGVDLELENLGNIAQLNVEGTPLFISGGGLPTRYRLMHIQFHWRSEHSINNEFYPAEIHFIHGQQRLEESDVTTHPFGQAIIAFFVKLGQNNENYEGLLNYFGDISVAKSRKSIPTFSLKQLLPASDHYNFFRYHGSWTSPPCWESVIWSVAEDFIEISQEQLTAMTQLSDEDGNQLTNTWRPVQNPNHRTVFTTNSRYSLTTRSSPGSRNDSHDARAARELFYLWLLVQLAVSVD